MKKQPQILEEKHFFKLPFEKGTLKLTKETLNSNSDFRKPSYYFPIHIRKIHFRYEILTLGVKLEDESEKLVYLKVKEHELLVSCNFDTDQTYVSRYAYFCLIGSMRYDNSVCFKKFYWPEFFDQNTGRSKYLQILNDRSGMDIYLKSKYPSFYKPGDSLLSLQKEPERPKDKNNDTILLEELPMTGYALGYCLADTNLTSYHTNHYPFLAPFHGILSKDREKVKSFISYLVNESDSELLTCTLKQEHLNEFCFKMRDLAPISSGNYMYPFLPNENEKERGVQLFELWHEALELILSQRHIYFCHTHGMKNLQGKPSRSWMKACEIRKETPHLVIKKINKGDYYQLELWFKVNGKMYVPAYPNITFFINPSVNWFKIYLLGSYNDYLVTSFFAKTQFKLAVLKCHYNIMFEDFVEELRKRYEIKES